MQLYLKFLFGACVSLFLIVAFQQFSFSQNATPAASPDYHSAQNHFTLRLPDQWVHVLRISPGPDDDKHEDAKFYFFDETLLTHNNKDYFVLWILKSDDVKTHTDYDTLKPYLINDARAHHAINTPKFDDKHHIIRLVTNAQPLENGDKQIDVTTIFWGSRSGIELHLLGPARYKARLEAMALQFPKQFKFDPGYGYVAPKKVLGLSLIFILLAKFSKLIIAFIILIIAFFKGKQKEKAHFKSIREREAYYIHLPALTSHLKTVVGADNFSSITTSEMVTGSVVLAADSFRTFVSKLISIGGGNLTPYQSMMDRARREAILRMKESAGNADMIVNVRIQSHSIGSQHDGRRRKSGAKAIEVLAYGTAIQLAKLV